MSSNQAAFQKRVPILYDCLSTQDIDNIQKHFERHQSAGLSYESFRAVLSLFGIAYPDEAFHNVCLKIDLDRDNIIKWAEFVAYFILELENDDNVKERLSIIPPIAKPANVLSTVQRNPIVRVEFVNNMFVTIGCYGDLYFWSSNWKLEATSSADEVPNTSASAIELSDRRQMRKSSKTLILDAVVLSDLQVLCISSVCCDLRFYDVSSSGKCNLRLYIRNFPSPLTAFHYHCSIDEAKNSNLIFGDMAGSVRVIDFKRNFNLRGATLIIRQVSYHELMKGKYETMTCKEYVKIHHDLVRQVSFITSMNSFISAAESLLTKSAYLPSVIIGNLSDGESQIVFKMNSGTTCFAFDETSKTLATGGPDFILRLWDPIMPNQPKAILSGHLSGVMFIFMQDDAAKLYSMDKKRIIMIWDVKESRLLQTFDGLMTLLGENVSSTAFYNDGLRELVVATKKIATVKCMPKINLDETDGFTHMTPVTVILLNKLYDFLVTCSVDSTIIVWDVWKGRRVNLITQAHTRTQHGVLKLVPITAGCFDAKHQFLLTAGEDGTLKVWNFNEGICLRNIGVGRKCLVSTVFWSSQRIIAMGADKTITEFGDSNDYKQQINRGKTWPECHSGAIICAATREPDMIVTSCSGGDLIFWSFETGQPYTRFNLSDPTQQLPLVYNKKFDNKKAPEAKHEKMKTKEKKLQGLRESQSEESKSPQEPKTIITAQCMLSLHNRPLSPSNGTLLVALTSGRIQVWSEYRSSKSQSFIADFEAVHVAGDVITAMTTDTQNCYLFTGSSTGYIKAWMILNFCLKSPAVEDISQVKLRQIFPFLWKDKVEGFAKQAVRKQEKPQLLNSYQGHKKSITGLIFRERNQVLISASSDKSVRLWHLSGQYIGTIGSPVRWSELSPNEAVPPNYDFRIPADLKHAVSYTTLKVLEGGNVPELVKRNIDDILKEEKQLAQVEMESEVPEASRRILQRPVVKKDVRTETQRRFEKPTLDISLPHIPVYSHLRIHPTVAINLPRTIPKCLETNNLPNLQYLFLEPEESKME